MLCYAMLCYAMVCYVMMVCTMKHELDGYPQVEEMMKQGGHQEAEPEEMDEAPPCNTHVCM